jgi:hypothetical protein
MSTEDDIRARDAATELTGEPLDPPEGVVFTDSCVMRAYDRRELLRLLDECRSKFDRTNMQVERDRDEARAERDAAIARAEAAEAALAAAIARSLEWQSEAGRYAANYEHWFGEAETARAERNALAAHADTLAEALRLAERTFASMPDAGLTADDPRWGWYAGPVYDARTQMRAALAAHDGGEK